MNSLIKKQVLIFRSKYLFHKSGVPWHCALLLDTWESACLIIAAGRCGMYLYFCCTSPNKHRIVFLQMSSFPIFSAVLVQGWLRLRLLTQETHTYVQKRKQVLFQTTSCPTGLLDIVIYFMFDIILCVLVEFH